MAPVYFSPPMLASRGASGEGEGSLPAQVATPPSVAELTPSVCFSLVQFKDLLRQYRALDDQVTLRFNRVSARSRDMGESAPPSLLQRHTSQFSSASAQDLGKSTYGTMPNDVCAKFWQQLVSVWSGREDAIKYCIATVGTSRTPTIADDPDLRLDSDARPAPAVQSRSEQMDEFIERQMRNELAIEQIIRQRSLEAFKERCRAFTPENSDAREQGYWKGH
ncbi:hypothetical protein MCUN1_002703 [Malassezia cuniculi]|uniref:Caffeine-induced death protein 2 n=1 Tax=Malassezia cuniculi TaxID=948313 RepID=A0AAF0J788_9BASI|nr:hypothetical protein MCUN1_002703 [Malassezia cuniculi]